MPCWIKCFLALYRSGSKLVERRMPQNPAKSIAYIVSIFKMLFSHFVTFKKKIKFLHQSNLISSQKILTSTKTFPCNFSVSPRIAERSEDFPEPTWPTTATREPLGILSEILNNRTIKKSKQNRMKLLMRPDVHTIIIIIIIFFS